MMGNVRASHRTQCPSLINSNFFLLLGRTSCSWSIWTFSIADCDAMCSDKTFTGTASGQHSLHTVKANASSAVLTQVALCAFQILQMWSKDQVCEVFLFWVLSPSWFRIPELWLQRVFSLSPVYNLQPTSEGRGLQSFIERITEYARPTFWTA